MHIDRNQDGLVVPRGRSLVRAHLPWILTVTLVAVAAACALSWLLQKPAFVSEVRILVSPAVTPSGTAVPPDMETERQVAVSGVVLAAAAEGSGMPQETLQEGLSVTVPAASTVLVIDYEDGDKALAQRGTQAVADAYIDYRKAQATALNAAPLATARGPNYLVNGLAGLTLGLLLGVGSALLRDHLDDRLRGPRDFVQETDLPVLATVPLRRRLPWRPEIALRDPGARAAEAYHQLSGKIARSARRRGGGTTTTVITSVDGAGDTASVAAHTAIALAGAGEKVLLAEADVRSPRLAGLFGVPPDDDLSQVLAGELPLGRALRTCRVEGLWLLPAGSGSPRTPGELFTHRAVGRMLSEVPADFDHVLVLSPPVLEAAEASVLAEHAQQLVVAAVVGRSTRQDLRSAAAELIQAPGPVLGGVVLHRGGAGRTRPHGTTTPSPTWDDDDTSPPGPDDGETSDALDEQAIDRRGRA